jgi:hypothetical protein
MFFKKAQIPDARRIEKIVQVRKNSKWLGTISIDRIELLNTLVEFLSIFLKNLDAQNRKCVPQVYLLFGSFISQNTMQTTA